MNMLTVTEFFTFIVIIVFIFLVLICWKTYRFEKKQPKAPALTVLDTKLDAISGQTGNIGAIQGKISELSAKIDPIQHIQKSVGDFSGQMTSLSAKVDKAAALADSFAAPGQDLQIMLDALAEQIDSLARQVEDIKTVEQKVCDLKTDTDQMKQQIEEIRTVHQKLLSGISDRVEEIAQNTISATQKKTDASPPAENTDGNLSPEKDTKPAEAPAPKILSGDALSAPQSSLQTEQKTAVPVVETVQKPSRQEPPASKNPAENQEKTTSRVDDEDEKKKQELLARI